MPSKLPHKINLFCFILALFGNLMIKSDPPIWVGFGDPYDYLAQSKIPLSDRNFYCPTPDLGFNGRPFTVPLFYKMAGSDPLRIIVLQEFINALTTFFLVYVLLLYLNKNYLKYFMVVIMYLLMSWWNIIGWSINLLSESISISLTFAWIASFLLLYKKRTKWYMALHILIAVLFSFSRDNCPYILLAFYSALFVGGWFWDKMRFRQYLVLLASGIIIFSAQTYTSKVGTRNKLPVLNNLVLRIMPNKEYFQWFKDRGLPCSDSLVAHYSGQKPTDTKIYNLYHDSNYNNLYKWINTKGTSTFIKFLISHPYHTFLLDQTPLERNRIFAYNLPGYTGGMQEIGKLADFIFPMFGKSFIILLSLVLIIRFKRRKQFIILFPVVLTLVYAIHAVLAYNSDALEVERHLFITNIMMQFIGILSILFILNPSQPLPNNTLEEALVMSDDPIHS